VKKDNNEIQSNEIQFKVLLILGLCIGFAILITVIQENSKSYIERNYFEIKNENYSGVISDLFEDRNNDKIKKVKLNDNSIRKVPFYIYDKLNLGDSIIKNKGSDSIVYIKQNGEIFYEDLNDLYRNKYLNQ